MSDLQISNVLERYAAYGRKRPAARSAAAEKLFASFVEREDGETGSQPEGTVDARELIRKRVEELLIKIQNGDTETYYPIGASFFTEKEWDKFLEKFDKLEEEIRTQMREEHAKRAEKQEKHAQRTEKHTQRAEKQEKHAQRVEKQEREEGQLLVSETTKCTYPASDPKEKDTLYIVCYTEDGIFCRMEGKEEYEWELAYDQPGQYEKVMDLIHQFSPEENLRFTSHENFWTDFLEDKIEMEDFMVFFQGTKNGVPDYSIVKDGSMYVDEAKAKYAPYMNPFGARFYTAEEMWEQQEKIIKENTEKTKISYQDKMYQIRHSEYNGERMFCEYPGGPLYTAAEIERRMYLRVLEAEAELE